MTITNAMTIDVEDYFQVSAFENDIRREDWERQESRVEKNTRELLNMFASLDIKATFFVLGWIAKRHPGLVREIASAGHEIASHGYSHRLVYTQTPELFKKETVLSKNLLEDLIQKPVLGYRAASYSITQASEWALDILLECGFKYDSSIFPIRHDRYGLSTAPRFPYQHKTPAGQSILEFPLSTKIIGTYRLPVSGGGYFRIFPYFLTRYALGSINKKEKEPFIFYLHPWEIDPQQPRIETNWLSRFRHYNNLRHCKARLQLLITDFKFSTVQQVLQL